MLWERDRALTSVLEASEHRYPQPDLQWIEDRFWVWIHYGAARVGRGEILEALDVLAFLRRGVLGPLSLLEAGERPSGVRRLEQIAPSRAAQLLGILGGPSAVECADALVRAAELFRELRKSIGTGLMVRPATEEAALEYLAEVRANLSPRAAF